MFIGLLFIKIINHELIALYVRKTNKMHNFLNPYLANVDSMASS